MPLVWQAALRRTFLDDVLQLPNLARCAQKSFRKFCQIEHPVLSAWRTAELEDDTSLLRELEARSGMSRATVYNWREKWLTEFGIDVAIPFNFLIQICCSFGSNSFSTDERRLQVLEAVETGDAEELLRCRRLDDRAFANARKNVLCPALEADLHVMPMQLPLCPVIGHQR